MAQWRSAAIALAEQRARELGDLTDADALAASAALLSLALGVPIDPARKRRTWMPCPTGSPGAGPMPGSSRSGTTSSS